MSGGDPVETRPGFSQMLDHIEGNGVRTVLVEDASRFARSVLAQELGALVMKERGVRVLTASGEDLTETDDPAKVMMRQVAAAFAQYEKTRLVHKLKVARDRKRATGVKVEGRKSLAELHPETVKRAKKLRRQNPKTHKRLSYRKIAAKLAEEGHLNENGNVYSHRAVRSMIKTP